VIQVTKKTTSAVFKDGGRVNKDLPLKVKRIEKLKPKAVEALCREILKEEKEEADFPYQEFLPKNCEHLAELYRNRWTIETSYRMTYDVRARTCSKNFAFRWFLVLFGLLVRNGPQ